MTPPRRLRFRAEPAEAGRRLDEAVAARASAALGSRVSKSQARRLIVVGAVSVAGRTVRSPGRPLPAGAAVEIRLGPAPPRTGPVDRPFALDARSILFEDGLLLAVDKPHGLPSQPTVDPARPSLVDAVKRYLAGGVGAAGGPAPYLGVHQRLDRDTTGVVVFARHQGANASLAEQFAGRTVVKRYLALTLAPGGELPARWREESRLVPASGRPPRMAATGAGGVRAVTDFHVVRRVGPALLVEARPLTGRKHQIRVQLAARGLPILGDVLYGGPRRLAGEPLPRPMLHALALELRHPGDGRPLRLESPLPPDFAALLSRLGARSARRRTRPRRPARRAAAARRPGASRP